MAEQTPIRKICDEFQFTQVGLSKRFGIPIRTVENWCRGNRQPPAYVVNMIRTILENERKG